MKALEDDVKDSSEETAEGWSHRVGVQIVRQVRVVVAQVLRLEIGLAESHSGVEARSCVVVHCN